MLSPHSREVAAMRVGTSLASVVTSVGTAQPSSRANRSEQFCQQFPFSTPMTYGWAKPLLAPSGIGPVGIGPVGIGPVGVGFCSELAGRTGLVRVERVRVRL